MSTGLVVVETDDLVQAATSMYDDVAVPVTTAVETLTTALCGSGAMAGSDPAGMSWAAAYDSAARVAVAAGLDVANGCYRLSTLFAQTARNWENADAASVAGVRHRLSAEVAALPCPTSLGTSVQLASAAGGSGAPPSGWSVIAHLVGYVWPDGHQDRLRRAAAAWTASADALQERSDFAAFVAVGFAVDRLPEAEDMHAVCLGMCDHLRSLAGAHRALAGACTELASHLDEVHHEVEGELRSLVEWTAGIEGAGLLFTAVTLGGSEAVAQAAEAARVARAAAKVGQLIARFGELARTAVGSVPTVQSIADSVSIALQPLLGSRLAVAAVTGARALPATERGIRTAEMSADGRIVAGASADVPAELASDINWADLTKLGDHFARHGSAFGAKTAADYARKATAFLHRGIREGLPTKIGSDQTIRIFDPATNTFGSYTSSGGTKTFFKPTSVSYWNRQPGVLR